MEDEIIEKIKNLEIKPAKIEFEKLIKQFCFPHYNIIFYQKNGNVLLRLNDLQKDDLPMSEILKSVAWKLSRVKCEGISNLEKKVNVLLEMEDKMSYQTVKSTELYNNEDFLVKRIYTTISKRNFALRPPFKYTREELDKRNIKVNAPIYKD